MIRFLITRNFATKISAGSTKNNKDSAGNRLGIKLFGGQEVGYNKILVRQRGFKWHPGYNVYVGRDHTLHSAAEGYVIHEYDENRHKTIVSVVPWKLIQRPKLKPAFCYHPELFPEKAQNNPPPGNFIIKEKPQKPAKLKKDIGTPLKTPKYIN
jgi:large subunit ribosomal protein L27